MAERLRAYEQSGGAIREFCKAQGVSAASFYQWRQRVKRGTNVMKFALLEPAGASVGGAIELRLPTGEALLIHAGAEASTLRMVLDVIREPRG